MNHNNSPSPFHLGEQQLQEQMGVRDQMEAFGKRVIRDYLPEQHRDFYQQLAFLFAGYVDNNGQPWASILWNQDQPGTPFVQSPNTRTLNINNAVNPLDPLIQAATESAAIGLLGIELPSRRRNRVSACITRADKETLTLNVHQTFGNCPQYIQQRNHTLFQPKAAPNRVEFQTLSATVKKIIEQSDTFFVASCTPNTLSDQPSAGADLSHRGGLPGFIQVTDNQLTIPDFPGNNHFNTLGNFLLNPKAGLLFVDFASGTIIMLTGTVELLTEADFQPHFANAQRFWRFHLKHGICLENALPFRFETPNYSANTLLSGTWEQALAKQRAEQLRQQWITCRVTRIEQESARVKSFYLKPTQHTTLDFKPGQHLTVKPTLDHQAVIRHYTVSNAPGDSQYRISVKQDGLISRHLHTRLQINDELEVKAPSGEFWLSQTPQPAVLIAAGIGITPMLSMMHSELQNLIKTRNARPLTLVYCITTISDAAFSDEIRQLEQSSSGNLRVIWIESRKEQSPTDTQNAYQGRINQRIVNQIIRPPFHSQTTHFYLCGPAGFMQDTYNFLIAAGITDPQIHAENFGPSSITRKYGQHISRPAIAKQALVRVVDSKQKLLLEQLWLPKDGNLLQFLQLHGVNPDFACRAGHCGSCTAHLKQGSVSHTHSVPQLAREEVRLCSAEPADSSNPSDLVIELL